MSFEITEGAIQSASTATSFARGYELYRDGAIFDTFIQGQVLTGKCQGSNAPYYKLQVKIDNDGFKEALCSCPYDWDGYCKHLVALMLTYIHIPERWQRYFCMKSNGMLLLLWSIVLAIRVTSWLQMWLPRWKSTGRNGL